VERWGALATSDEVVRGNEKRETGREYERGTGKERVRPKRKRRETEGGPRKMTMGVNRAK